MSGEFLRPDLDPATWRASWAEISQALESLRERLYRLERAGEQSSAPRPTEAPMASDSDPHALAVVQDILSIPSSTLDPGELFTLAMDRLSRLLAADRAMLFVVEAGGTRLVPRSAHGFRRDDLPSIVLQPGDGIVGRAFRERRVLTYTSGGDSDPPDPFIERFPVWAAIAVPVRAEDDVVGVLYAGRRRLGAPFGGDDVLLLLVIADRVGGGLVHQSLLDRRARHVARLAELASLARHASRAASLDDLLAQSCEAGCRLVDVRAAALAVPAGDHELELVAARGLPGPIDAWRRIDVREGLTAELYAQGTPVGCRDVQSRAAPERSVLGDGGFHGCLLLPLDVRGRRVGVLYLADTEVRDFSSEETEAAAVLATIVAAAMDNRPWQRPLGGALDDAHPSPERLVQVEKARTLGEMAGGLAREFSNVFAIILGKARLALTRSNDDAVREGLGQIEEAAWRGADIVHRLAALAAPASGEAVAPVDLTVTVQDVLALTRARWNDELERRDARIEIVTDLASVPPVLAAPSALRDALVNLVVNAVEAMPEGGRLAISTRPRRSGVVVTIDDTGPGIPESASQRVFDPFFTTRAPRHMGLGLTVAHAVITRAGGRIDIASGPRSGARVSIWLPSAETVAEPLAGGSAGVANAPAGATSVPDTSHVEESPRATETGAERSRVASILVLEDEEAVRSLLVEALTRAGYQVDAAIDGLSGLAKLESGHYDVVLTDLALPQRSGLAVARSVKRLQPQTPVVLITGWGHLLDPERLREHGVDLMLVKPFRLERVLSVVADALRLRLSA